MAVILVLRRDFWTRFKLANIGVPGMWNVHVRILYIMSNYKGLAGLPTLANIQKCGDIRAATL